MADTEVHTRNRSPGSSRGSESTTRTSWEKMILTKTILNKMMKIFGTTMSTRTSPMKKVNKKVTNLLKMMMMTALTSMQRMKISSGRSSTRDSKLARSSRARRKVGRNQQAVDEVDPADPPQVPPTSRTSRRRRRASALTVVNSATGKVIPNAPESNQGRLRSSRSMARTSSTTRSRTTTMKRSEPP